MHLRSRKPYWIMQDRKVENRWAYSRMIGKMLLDSLSAKSLALIVGLHRHIHAIAMAWVAVMVLACGMRIIFSATPFDFGSSVTGTTAFFGLLLYALVIFAPVAFLYFALKAFPANGLLAQPEIRLARYGKWRDLNCLDASKHPLFGATGVMASLVIGMLINVPVRTLEFLISIPALGSFAPAWLSSLFVFMTADLIVINSLYVVAFVMAIRHVPWFPRFLLLVWALDVCSQLVVAQMVAAIPNIPVAVETELSGLLTGNLQKVMISVAIWLPYLLLSERVNLTYRRRVRVG
jgi:hypothetical protein